jgi:UDP-N-acetylmuramoylalanine--D-glutamate ligase
MRVLIFGLGLLGGGFAAASYFLDQGAEVRITDLRSESVLGEPLAILKSRGATAICQEHREEDFFWADIVIKNPAVSDKNPLLGLARRIENDISYLFYSPLIQNLKIIAITGTKGKTTTAAAVAHVLHTNEREALQCGNMGISGFSILLELEKREKEGKPLPQYLVCELSSWQIRDTFAAMREQLPEFCIIVLTSLFPDHLNTYTDYESYKKDKWLLFTGKSKYILVSKQNRQDVIDSVKTSQKKILSIEQTPGCLSVEPRFQPTWAVCKKLGLTAKQIKTSLSTFRGVPHRQEQVGVYENIVFINDSSATIPEAVAFSCSSCPYPYVLICGGTDKNLSPLPMLNALNEAKEVVLLDGNFTRNKLMPILISNDIPFLGPFSSMRESVEAAYAVVVEEKKLKNTMPITAIMLSPGAASFGMFKHEFDRGDQFCEIAHALTNTTEIR